MGLLLDVGTGGALRGLSEQERDVGTVHLPEDVIPAEDSEAANAARAAMEALCTRRRQLAARMVRPARGGRGPR